MKLSEVAGLNTEKVVVVVVVRIVVPASLLRSASVTRVPENPSGHHT